MKTEERIEKIRGGWCGRCGLEGVMKPADVTKFKLAGTNTPAPYRTDLWDGFKCTNCGNEAAIGKSDAPEQQHYRACPTKALEDLRTNQERG